MSKTTHAARRKRRGVDSSRTSTFDLAAALHATEIQLLNHSLPLRETGVKPSLTNIERSTTEPDRHTMKAVFVTLTALLVALAGSADLHAEGAPQLQRLALCQDTWFDWKDDATRMEWYSNYFQTQFDGSASDGSFAPKSPMNALGGRVARVYPGSVGTGVGFSLTVNADHARLRTALEQQLGKPMKCETSEGTRACELQLGAKKTVLLMTDQNGRAQSSLVGCYYFYQQ